MATTKTPRTKRGTAPGQGKPLPEIARKLVLPTGIASTDWPKVHKVCTQKLGVTLDSWQQDAGRVILSRRADGDLAVMVDGVGMSLPRQVGKTFLLAALIFALCILRPGLLVIWSAHHGKTHAETFLAMQAFAKRLRVAPYVEQVFVGSGDEEIRFVNGSRILFGARERGFGRGIPGVDILVFDEAQILSDRALANMLATMNVSTFGLALYIGTPPKPEDNAESFKRMRADAYAGRLTDGAWIEFGAKPGSDPNDRTALAEANPSYPHRTPEKSILRLQRKLAPEDFLREGYGIWDDEDEAAGDLSQEWWKKLADPMKNAETERPSQVAFGLYVAQDRSAWIAVAWNRPDGHKQVQLVDPDPIAAYHLVERCKGLARDWQAKVVPPPKDFEKELADAGVDLEKMPAEAFPAATGLFLDAFNARELHHGNQPALNAAAKVARLRDAGTQGEKAWLIRDHPEVGPIVAATRALYGLSRADQPFNVW